MLHRFISGDSLGKDFYGSTDPPEVVIRQVGQSVMQVWDLKRREVLEYQGSSLGLLGCFDPRKSFYFYEPDESLKEPYRGELSIPTMCSVSPDRRRYKEFLKKGAVKIYMPTWTLPELEAVGKFVCDRSPEQMPLDQSDISERFKTFGGIFRHVFAEDSDNAKEEQERAIQELDPKKFLLNDIDQGRKGVSHFVAQYRVVSEGEKAFRKAHLDFVNEEVQKEVETEFTKLDLNDKVRLLKKSDESPSFLSSMSRSIYDIFEEITAKRLCQGVRWKKKNLTDLRFSKFKLRLVDMKGTRLNMPIWKKWFFTFHSKAINQLLV